MAQLQLVNQTFSQSMPRISYSSSELHNIRALDNDVHVLERLADSMVERFDTDFIVLQVKFGGVSILVWGCFSWFGADLLTVVQGNIKEEPIFTFLDNSVLPTL
ncbi:hypothetical protein TNCT_240691 [Trichonephila clavata]|uniref:Uncharacterized protein n=1 Tax=Trichonephila clavata TaxID=2740835 RepID=A0A8X6LP26_TRICU|nr:hypothetical protein TNCT_240691 [Trichonephila clavata]